MSEPRRNIHPPLRRHFADAKKKVMRIYTDPKRIRADISGTVEGNRCSYHDAFNPNTRKSRIRGAIAPAQGR
jgi:hypothetical protein